MYKTLTKSDFRDAFVRMGRKNNFSYDGLSALYDYLEEIQYGELDVIDLCCNFIEYNSLSDFQEYYDDVYKSIDDIADKTIVIPIDDERFIIQCF